MVSANEIGYQTNATATQMAETIFGEGVQVTDASFTGDNRASAIYTDGDDTLGVAPSDTGVILSTGRADRFTNSNGDANQSNSTSTNNSGVNNNSDFNTIAGARTYDASWLDVTFIPDGDFMTMQFVFASDEYPEYAGSVYNDVVGVWINGVHVPLSVASGPTAVSSVNQNDNSNLYVSNTNDEYNTEMDGFTVTMSLTIPVNDGEENTIRIGIADVSDSSYDSNLLIAANSVQTGYVAVEDSLTTYVGSTNTFDVLSNDVTSIPGTLVITHINGDPVTVGSTVILPTGQTIIVNADGTLTISTDNDEDTVSFTYTSGVENSAGIIVQSDTAMVTLETIPCFVRGTRVQTPDGMIAVEDLSVGDMVETFDNGPQPVRWIGNRAVAGRGKLAPIRIAAGTFGSHGSLMVSPQHRILVRDSLAELLFGQSEVLIKAKDLINGRGIRTVESDEVEYFHIMFEEHQVVFSEGLASESFLPGPQSSEMFDQEVKDELTEIFPELEVETGEGYSPAARLSLKRHEAKTLLGTAA
jgi:hypothetical protein